MTSSSISTVGYDAREETLEVEFHNGRVYQYYGVPERVYAALLGASSIGGYFNSTVRDSYPYERLGVGAGGGVTGSSSRRSAQHDAV